MAHAIAANVDAALRVQMRIELAKLHKSLGATMIYVTHDQSEAMSISDTIIIMNKGEIAQVGTPMNIYYHPNSEFVADFIGQMNILRALRAAEGLQIGRYSLPAPQGLGSSGAVSVAVRPEDLVLGPQATGWSGGKAWEGTIDQAIDLGHYRKMLVAVPGLFGDDTDGTVQKIKVYVPKAVDVKEGERVALFPSRYLVYSGEATPHEVRIQAEAG
mgnify:CR=1 FL=1